MWSLAPQSNNHESDLIQVKHCDASKVKKKLSNAKDSIGVGPIVTEVLTLLVVGRGVLKSRFLVKWFQEQNQNQYLVLVLVWF